MPKEKLRLCAGVFVTELVNFRVAEWRQFSGEEESIELPFYGGAKGSVLKLVKNANGTLSTHVRERSEEAATAIERKADDKNGFAENLAQIQSAAQKLVTIQQLVKNSGQITDDDKKTYVENLAMLGKAASELAKMNSAAGEDDFRLLITGKLESCSKNLDS